MNKKQTKTATVQSFNMTRAKENNKQLRKRLKSINRKSSRSVLIELYEDVIQFTVDCRQLVYENNCGLLKKKYSPNTIDTLYRYIDHWTDEAEAIYLNYYNQEKREKKRGLFGKRQVFLWESRNYTDDDLSEHSERKSSKNSSRSNGVFTFLRNYTEEDLPTPVYENAC